MVSHSSPAEVIDVRTESLHSTFVEYIEGARIFLETEADKESQMLQEIRLHFTEFIRHLIRNTAGEKNLLLPICVSSLLYLAFPSWISSSFSEQEEQILVM